MVIAAFLIFLPGPDPEQRFSTFRSRMVRTALRGYAMDIETRDPGQIRGFLDARKAHGDWLSPAGMIDWPVLSCAVLTWWSQPAAMIC